MGKHDTTAAVEQPLETALERDDRLARLEAVLFVAKAPLHARKLSQYANLADGTDALTLIHRLNRIYDAGHSAFRVTEVAGGWQLRTRSGFASWLRRLPHVPKQMRLSAPAMETLAVVAYRQPVMRADIEAVRGVACGEIIRQLMERDLVRVIGRSEDLGRPFLYGTTKYFLEVFGLRDIDDLPRNELFQAAEDTNGEYQTGESAVTVTLTPTQHDESVKSAVGQDPELTDSRLDATTTRSTVIAEDDAEDDEWDDDDDGDDYDYGDDDAEESDDEDDEWDDEDDEWEEVEDGETPDDDEYEYEEVEVDEEDEEDEDGDDEEYEYEDDLEDDDLDGDEEYELEDGEEDDDGDEYELEEGDDDAEYEYEDDDEEDDSDDEEWEYED